MGSKGERSNSNNLTVDLHSMFLLNVPKRVPMLGFAMIYQNLPVFTRIHLGFYVCSGSIVVTTLDCGPRGSRFKSRVGANIL